MTAVVGFVLAPGNSLAATRYHVRVATAMGYAARLAFDFTWNDSAANRVTLLNLDHNASTYSRSITGGPITGAIAAGIIPADTSGIEGDGFFSELVLNLDEMGTYANYDLEVSENAPTSGRAEDEFAFFFIPRQDTLPYPTSDALGTRALFAIDVTGAAGGDLHVFSPMTFVPPDTLRLDATLLDVPIVTDDRARLRFTDAYPNPSKGRFRFSFAMPHPGGSVRVRIYDAAGRFVAEPLNGTRKPGEWSILWNGTNAGGQDAAPGVYLVQIQAGWQSLVRRVVLTR
jgi:hypothetical protein